jgi:ABC-type Fe3+-hydroxamate transport system substrate-binding protein
MTPADHAALPTRIVSLVPSQTELLYSLGLEDEVIGITKFCVHPAHWFRTKTRVGGTKQVHIDRVKALTPDLIIANKEENEKDQVLELQKIAPVWVSDIHGLSDALHMMREVGRMTGRIEQAAHLCAEIEGVFRALPSPPVRRRAAYLIWKDPYMAAGPDTFISDMLQRCGWTNAVTTERYPVLTAAQLGTLDCHDILLSSEPYPFREKHAAALMAQLPGRRVICVDGEMFSWYGSRLLHAAPYFQQLLQRLAC